MADDTIRPDEEPPGEERPGEPPRHDRVFPCLPVTEEPLAPLPPDDDSSLWKERRRDERRER